MPVAKKVDLKTLLSLIRKSRRVLVSTHQNPDGDGIGSMIAFGSALKRLGKRVTMYMADPVPKMYRFLAGHKDIRHSLNPKDTFDLSFIIDLGDIQRVGPEFVAHPGRGLTVSIDHHRRGIHDADLNYCLPDQASSGEVVYGILKALKVKLDSRIATGLYTALVTDTGSFKYSNTSQSSFLVAADLVGHGVDVWKVAQNCFETSSGARMELLKRVLQRLEVHPEGKIAWIDSTRRDLAETGATPDEAEGFINYARSLEGVEIALHFKEAGEDEYKISFRSKNYADVGKVAAQFGGGGHARASGCTLRGPLVQVRNKVLVALLPLVR